MVSNVSLPGEGVSLIPGAAAGSVLLESGGSGKAISAMTVLPNPPTHPGAMVPVVIPGVSTNYESPIASLLTGANGTNSVQGEIIQIYGGSASGGGGGNIGLFAGGDSAAGAGGNIDLYGGTSDGGSGGHVQVIGGSDSALGSGGDFVAGSGDSAGGGGGTVIFSAGNDSAGGPGGIIQLDPGTSASGTVGVVQVNSDPSLMAHSLSWVPGQSLNGRTIYTATRKELVTAGMCRIDAANGTAAAASIYKAPSATAFSGGTNLASNSFDLTGTATHNQTLSLGSQSALLLNAGDSVGIVQTGSMVLSAGCITIHSTPQ